MNKFEAIEIRLDEIDKSMAEIVAMLIEDENFREKHIAQRIANGVEYARQWLCFAMEHADDAAEKGQEKECGKVK